MENKTGCIYPVKKENGKFKICGSSEVKIVDIHGSQRAFCPKHLIVIKEKVIQGKNNNNYPDVVRKRKKLRIDKVVMN